MLIMCNNNNNNVASEVVLSLSLPTHHKVTGDRLRGSLTHFFIFDLQVQKNTVDLLHCVSRECLLFLNKVNPS